jgi:lipid-binding SYLF domain-containing protein
MVTGLVSAGALLQTSTHGQAASGPEINASVGATLERFYYQVPGAQGLAARAAGVLVFPTVIKAGFGVGGEYGEGAMQVGGRTVAFYNVLSASIGFQVGAQARSVIIIFMTAGAGTSSASMAGGLVLTARWCWSRSAPAARSTPTRSPIPWWVSSSTPRV